MPGSHHEARRVVADLAHRRREEDRPDRPRADQVHVAADDVPELRDLVELRALQEAADRRVERIARREQARADPLLGVDQQRPELEDVERLHVPADARAPVEHRARGSSASSRPRWRARRAARSRRPSAGDQRSATSGSTPSGRRPRVAELVPAGRATLNSLRFEGDHVASPLGLEWLGMPVSAPRPPRASGRRRVAQHVVVPDR